MNQVGTERHRPRIATLARIACLLAAVAVVACGGSDGGTPVAASLPASAPAGTPVGAAITQTIDASGGTLTSADGRLALTVPLGALAAATSITLQPITNTAPNGAGLAYRLGPEGTTFSSPVTLKFQLTTDQAPELGNSLIAYQRGDGFWLLKASQIRDAASNSLVVTTTHFSDWVLLKTLYLKPDTARLKTGTSTDFAAWILCGEPDCDPLLLGPYANDVLIPQPLLLTNQVKTTWRLWSVNGAPGGTSAFGLIGEGGHFTAPATVPNPNTSTIGLTAKLGSIEVTALASAEIYDQEKWTGSSDITLLDGTRLTSTFTFVQKGDAQGNLLRFTLQEGSVTIKPPATDSQGCLLTVTPTTHAIAPADGDFTVEYSLANGPGNATVTGGGATRWLATFDGLCPSPMAPYTYMNNAGGEWWPIGFTGPTPVLVEDGHGVITASSPTASGTVTINRMP